MVIAPRTVFLSIYITALRGEGAANMESLKEPFSYPANLIRRHLARISIPYATALKRYLGDV
jgi:hypothetical protein